MEIYRFKLTDPESYGLKHFSIPVENFRNGMVVRMPNHLGDAVMALPALTVLKKLLPEHCGLFVAAPEMFRQFYAALPIVDVFIGLSKAHANWRFREIRQLRQLAPGCGMFFNNSPRDVIAMRLAGVSNLYGTDARMRKFLLTGVFRMKRQQIPGVRANEHLTSRYLAMAMAVGAPAWDGNMPEFRLWRSGDECKRTTRSICEHSRVLALGPGAAYGDAKCWPASSYYEVAEWWINRGGIVAVLGGRSEYNIGAAVCNGLPENKCFNLCGMTDLQELMLILQNAVIAVCNDSGIMHLGAALGKKGIAIFGSTDPTATGPVSGEWKALSMVPECSPCFRHVCCREEKVCMKSITPAMVIEELKESLQNRSGS